MTTVQALIPGDLVLGPRGLLSATFVATTAHPLFPGLELVIWRLSDGSWMHDALRRDQEVGTTVLATSDDRREALRRALLEPTNQQIRDGSEK